MLKAVFQTLTTALVDGDYTFPAQNLFPADPYDYHAQCEKARNVIDWRAQPSYPTITQINQGCGEIRV